MSGAVAQEAGTPEIPEIGEVLDDRFELLARLGEGGMGHVFRARDRKLGREIALKLINPRYLHRPERIQRFFREQELNQRVQRYPYLVEVVDGGRLQHSDWPYLVMELVGSTDLATFLARDRLPPRRAARMARQVAGALRALHAADVVHRDVNATNIMLEGDDVVLIDLSHAGDAGAPQVAAGQAGRLTQANEFPGTHHYMSREQSWAAPAHPSMDIYAFGITLIHMLTGYSPRGAGREAFLELARQGKIDPFRVDVRVYKQVPTRFADLAHACIVDEPAQRPTAEAVVRELDEILVAMSMPPVEDRAESREAAGPVAASSVAALVPPPVVETATCEEGSAGGERRRRAVAIALAVVALVLVALALGWWASEGSESRAETKATQPAEVEASAVVELGPPAAAVEAEPPIADDEPPPIAAPEPEPKVKPRARVKRPARKPDPSEPAKVLPHETEACRQRVSEAIAANEDQKWARIASLTQKRECFENRSQWAEMRAPALYETGHLDQCIALAERFKQPIVQKYAKICQAQKERE